MHILFNLFCSIIHFLFSFVIFAFALITNNIKFLTYLLILMALVKISYLFFGRCFLTLYEDNEHFANAPTLLTRTITNLELKDIHVENILINLGLLVILNKILILLVINYYNKIK